jgi:hypothetical protein
MKIKNFRKGLVWLKATKYGEKARKINFKKIKKELK